MEDNAYQALANAALRLYSDSRPLQGGGFRVSSERLADLVLALAACHDLVDDLLVEVEPDHGGRDHD